jgi:hypothetical protein
MPTLVETKMNTLDLECGFECSSEWLAIAFERAKFSLGRAPELDRRPKCITKEFSMDVRAFWRSGCTCNGVCWATKRLAPPIPKNGVPENA